MISRCTQLANTIVAYQIALEMLFWMAPSILKVVTEQGLGIDITLSYGPVTLTSFMVYVMSCSVLYWSKLRAKKVGSPENT
ncbi:hypothetical protein QR680_015813 [Steinernema hermaphroditum]|uniref:Uncharacterized protein n=1 Tax=Steinernema hermaphroditum TaxID=289476 RepID=A0AA39HB65_9BILA|nr:hypothetical protein QR680_015813 [Steinernema hermaphroditum]